MVVEMSKHATTNEVATLAGVSCGHFRICAKFVARLLIELHHPRSSDIFRNMHLKRQEQLPRQIAVFLRNRPRNLRPPFWHHVLRPLPATHSASCLGGRVFAAINDSVLHFALGDLRYADCIADNVGGRRWPLGPIGIGPPKCFALERFTVRLKQLCFPNDAMIRKEGGEGRCLSIGRAA